MSVSNHTSQVDENAEMAQMWTMTTQIRTTIQRTASVVNMLTCKGVAGTTDCKIHGKDFIEYKCKFCCKIASWFCWGTTLAMQDSAKGTMWVSIQRRNCPSVIIRRANWEWNIHRMGRSSHWDVLCVEITKRILRIIKY